MSSRHCSIAAIYNTGVVCFEHAELAEEAQQRFDGLELCGRKMSVRYQGVDSSSNGGGGSDLGGGEV